MSLYLCLGLRWTQILRRAHTTIVSSPASMLNLPSRKDLYGAAWTSRVSQAPTAQFAGKTSHVQPKIVSLLPRQRTIARRISPPEHQSTQHLDNRLPMRSSLCEEHPRRRTRLTHEAREALERSWDPNLGANLYQHVLSSLNVNLMSTTEWDRTQDGRSHHGEQRRSEDRVLLTLMIRGQRMDDRSTGH